MEPVTGRTRGGSIWCPEFLSEIDSDKCIGCGRCFKVCPRNVLSLFVPDDEDDDDDCEDDMQGYMKIENADDCIGCTACSKVCSRGCFAYLPVKKYLKKLNKENPE